MGKDRRKKDTNKKPTSSAPADIEQTSSASIEVDCGPKGQREPRNRARSRADQKELSKNTPAEKEKNAESKNSTPATKEEPKEEPVNTAELFANLKRETDDIKALTTKKYNKRQIFSNWARYEEEPLPEPQYEVEIQGADFESLLKAPESGAFQFKSEKMWEVNLSDLSGELFSLDVDLLADGLATLPLYKKLDIPMKSLPVDMIEEMDAIARSALKQYEVTRNVVRNTSKKHKEAKLETAPDILMEREPSPVPTEKLYEDKAALNFDIDHPENQNDIHEEVSIKNVKINQESDMVEAENNVQCTPIRNSPEVFETKLENINSVHVSKMGKRNPLITEEANDFSANPAEQKFLPSKENNEVMPSRDVKREVSQVKENEKDIEKDTSFNKDSRKEIPVKEAVKEIKKQNAQLVEKMMPEEIKSVVPGQEIQQAFESESSENIEQEPAIPLEQRTGRRRARGQAEAVAPQQTKTEAQLNPEPKPETKPEPKPEIKSEPKFEIKSKSKPEIKPQLRPEVKSQETDDLDFLLSLKKPIRNTQTGSKPSQVTKPSIEDDTATQNSSQLNLLASQQKTEDLEDWLDSMLDD